MKISSPFELLILQVLRLQAHTTTSGNICSYEKGWGDGSVNKVYLVRKCEDLSLHPHNQY